MNTQTQLDYAVSSLKRLEKAVGDYLRAKDAGAFVIDAETELRLARCNARYIVLEKSKGDAKRLKPRIKQTVWGNWYGYLGTRKAEYFCDQREAEEWLNEQQKEYNAWSERYHRNQ